VVMKGEVVPESSRWIGIPTRPVEQASKAACKTASLPSTAPASDRLARWRAVRPTARRHYNHKCDGIYLQSRKLRASLIYSAGIAAAFCFGFVGVSYLLPMRSAVSIAALQAEKSPDPELVLLHPSGSITAQAGAQDIERYQQNSLLLAPEGHQTYRNVSP